jgi:hypothetical protein
MSYTEYLRTKQASQPKIIAVQKPVDASLYISRKRMEASSTFLDDGSGKGSLGIAVDRPTNAHASTSYTKASGRVPDASSYTAFRGGVGIRNGSTAEKTVKVEQLGICPPAPSTWTYPSASSVTRAKESCPSERGDPISNRQFVDNTVRLSAMHPHIVDGTRECELSVPNHEPSPGLPVCDQKFAVGKPFFMRSPPNPQAPNTSDNKVGSYFNPRSGYVENKHGYVKPSGPIPEAPGKHIDYMTQPAHLKINKPTLFNIKI